MEYKKDLFILEFYNGIVSSVNNSMKKLLFAYFKQKAFFILAIILIFCVIKIYPNLNDISKIATISAIILFVGFYFIFNKLMNKKPK